MVPVGVLLGPIDDLADVRGELSWGARGGLLGLRDLDGGQHGGAGDDGDQALLHGEDPLKEVNLSRERVQGFIGDCKGHFVNMPK